MSSRNVTVHIRAATGQYKRAVSSATKATSGLGKGVLDIKKIAIGAGAAGAIAIAAIGAAAIKVGIQAATSFAKFERSLSQIEGLVGVSHEALAGMTDELKQIGIETATGPQELAEALFFITSAGLEGAEAMEALEVSAKASAAGLGDTATIADVVTSAVNAYGKAISGAGEATDVLVATVKEGKAEAPALAGALGRVIPIASSMGISFDQVGAAIAAMTRVGLDANEAGTALRSIMTSLLKPTTQADEALTGLGLSASGLRSQIREEGLLATLEGLATAFDGNSDATTAVFGNVRALSGVMSLLGENTEATRGIFERMEDTLGQTDTAFGVAAETGAFAFEQAKVRIETALLDVGEKILPKLADAMERIAPSLPGIVEGFGELAILMVNLAEKGLPGVIGFLSGMDDQLLRSSLKWFDMRKKIQDTINVLNHIPLVEFSDTYNGLDDEMRDWIITQQLVSKSLKDGVTPINVAQQALLQMADNSRLTKERYADLQGVLGLTDAQMLQATDSILANADANNLNWNSTDRLTHASSEYREEVANLWKEEQQAGEITRFLGAAQRFTAEQLEGLGGAAGSAAGGITTFITPLGIVNEALAAAAAEAKGLSDAMLELTNPTFKAVKAVESLAGAEAALAKEEKKRTPDVKKLATLQLAVVEATLKTQSALDALGFDPANLEGSIAAIQAILGGSRQEAVDLLTTLGVLDDQGNIVVKFNLETSISGPLAGSQNPLQGFARFLPDGKAHGGPVSGGSPYIVGEAGPELFVPGQSGQIVPNNILSQNSSSVVVDLSGSTFGGTTDVAQGVQQGLIAAGVSEEIEWAGTTTIR